MGKRQRSACSGSSSRQPWRRGAISYPYDATLTSTNSSFIIANKLPVYAAGYNGHTATINGIDSADVIQSTGFGGNVVINS